MTLQEWYQDVTSSFATANIENPAQEARWLIEAALKKEAGFVRLYPTYLPSLQETQIIESWVSRRLMGEPLSRIKGVREFWSLPFYLSAETLDPRPETEILVEGVLTWLGKRNSGPLHILDLGTGSGSILISLLHECPQATGIGIDISEKALETARINAVQNKVDSRITFAQGNWGEALVDAFDIIVSNPPYIPLTDKPTLDNHVLNFDPPMALFGGEDGLMAYRHLCHDIQRLLKPGGLAALEIGSTQRLKVEHLFHEVGFQTLFVLKDLAQHERVLGFDHSL